MSDDYLTVQQAADLAGVSVNTVRSWVYRGKLPADHWQPGGRRPQHLYHRDDVLAAAGRPPGRPRKPKPS